jgi:hypothetical protein
MPGRVEELDALVPGIAAAAATAGSEGRTHLFEKSRKEKGNPENRIKVRLVKK